MAVTRPLTGSDRLQVPPAPQAGLLLQLAPGVGPPVQTACVCPFGIGAGPSAVHWATAAAGASCTSAASSLAEKVAGRPGVPAGTSTTGGCGSGNCWGRSSASASANVLRSATAE